MQPIVSNAESAPNSAMKRSLWIALLATGSIGFSFALACATPFAALATLAAINMPRRDLLSLVGVAWLANQAIGYGVLGYPQTLDSFAWGGAIGIAAALAAAIAVAVAARVARLGSAGTISTAFLAAFAVYELALYAVSFVLPTGAEAFSLPVVWRIFYVNVIALVGLLVLHRLALAAGLIVSGKANGRDARTGLEVIT
jgi:hypothetical protein